MPFSPMCWLHLLHAVSAILRRVSCDLDAVTLKRVSNPGVNNLSCCRPTKGRACVR